MILLNIHINEMGESMSKLMISLKNINLSSLISKRYNLKKE